MISFKTRSTQSELMDDPNISDTLLYKNLKELDLLNRYLGGYSNSIEGIKQLVTDKQKVYRIVDLGCGSGDVLKFIARWARLNNFQVLLTGVDKNKNAVKYLTEQSSEYPEINGVVSDYKEYFEKTPNIDIVHCSLFCHHLNDDEVLELFIYFRIYAAKGFVVNDLQRSKVAYYCVWLFTRILNGSTLSKHDGPVSVLRAFTHHELMMMLGDASIEKFSIHWRWAFRYLVVAKTQS